MQQRNAIPGFGHCIYCETPGTSEPLTNEHIIPYGLGGRRYVEYASCARCQCITHDFETKALQGFLWPARAHVGIKPRHKKRARKTLPIYVEQEFLIGLKRVKKIEVQIE